MQANRLDRWAHALHKTVSDLTGESEKWSVTVAYERYGVDGRASPGDAAYFMYVDMWSLNPYTLPEAVLDLELHPDQAP